MHRLSTQSPTRKLASVERFFSRDVAAFTRQLAELDAQIDPDAVPRPGDSNHERVQAVFQESQDACRQFESSHAHDPGVIHDAQEWFRQETDAWFRRSWIAHRARTKPSGFAGDFEMLLKLYEEATPARGLGGYLDLCILDLPLARAVRARLASTKAFLIEEVLSRSGEVQVLDIACGPCREFLGWPEIGGGRRINAVAIDNDPQALDYVADHVARRLAPWITLRPERYNALRTRSEAANRRKFGTFDIIYSAGLCDYLSDEHLVAMMSAWDKTLNENGVLFVAFKDTTRYDKTPYQWHLDWFFYQRTLEDVLNLYAQAGLDPRSVQTIRDGTEIIIHFVTRQTAARPVRTDHAQAPAQPAANRPARSAENE